MIRLNLYHEVEKQKAIKRRDPLKLSMMGLGLVAFGFAAYYLFELGVQHSLTSEAAQIDSEFNRLKGKAEAAKKREDELSLSVSLADSMVKRIENRFYWAPVLDQIVKSTPREVQFQRVAGEITNDKYKRVTIDLVGICAGAEPRKVAEDLRRALMEKFGVNYKHANATFKSLEDGKDLVKLDGKDMPTAAFDINLQIQAGEDDAPPPPARKKK